jgi:hypothetical protein
MIALFVARLTSTHIDEGTVLDQGSTRDINVVSAKLSLFDLEMAISSPNAASGVGYGKVKASNPY